MKRILLPGLALVALVLLSGLAAGACGDDDDAGGNGSPSGGGTTLGAYLKQVNDVQEGVTQATDAIGEDAEEAFSEPARARQTLSAAVDVGESAVASLKRLTPPDEAVAEHEALIAAGEDLVAVVQTLVDDLQGMEAGPDFDTFAADAQAPGSALSTAINALVSACESMQVVSEENKSGVDLDCPAEVS